MITKKDKKDLNIRLIGKGSSGCVYRPNILCNKATKRSGNIVSKLMYKKQAEKEIEKYSIVKQVDPNHRFSLPKPTLCKNIRKSELGKFKYFRDCSLIEMDKFHKTFFKSKDDKTKEQMEDVLQQFFYTINYKFSGMDMNDKLNEIIKMNLNHSQKVETFLEYFFSMKNIFEGLVSMNKHKIAHLDIKTKNLMIKETDKNKAFKLIDFGISMPFEDILNKENKDMMLSGYFVWPTELRYVFDMSKKNAKEAYQANYGYAISHNIFFNNLNNPWEIPMEHAELYEKYKILLNPKNPEYEMNVKQLISKIDVYSLGISLVMIWCNILSIFFNNSEIGVHAPEQYIYKDTLKLIHSLIMNMITPYYKQRFSAEQCLEYFKQIQIYHNNLTGKRNKKTNKKRTVKKTEKEEKKNNEEYVYIKINGKRMKIKKDELLDTTPEQYKYDTTDYSDILETFGSLNSLETFKQKKTKKNKKFIKCKNGKIYNYKTGRCISKKNRYAELVRENIRLKKAIKTKKEQKKSKKRTEKLIKRLFKQ